jgi:hypothetical protein
MSNSKSILTKSRFKMAIECPTKLFYAKNSEKYANIIGDNDFLEALAEGGFQVGELAKLYFPNGHDIKTLDYHKSIEATEKYLEIENVIIFEAAIAFENLFIRVDILKKTGNKIDLIEVKAKSFDSKNPDFLNKNNYINSKWRPYLNDIAFQTYVIGKAYPDWNVNPHLMLVDKSKQATVSNLNQYFRIKKNKNNKTECYLLDGIKQEDLGNKILTNVPVGKFVKMIWEGRDRPEKDKTKEEQKSFFYRVQEYAKYFENNKKFPVNIGIHCKSCEFKNDDSKLKSGFEECWKEKLGENFDISEPHIFDIWNFTLNKTFFKKNIFYIKDLDVKNFFMKKTKNKELIYKSDRARRQALQVQKIQQNDSTENIMVELYKEMDKWKFPLHFIDFETSMVAIPFYKGCKPYEQIAFQFSCHTIYEDGKITHKEWINTKKGEFPNFKFVKELKKVLDNDNGTIFRYAAHENTVLQQIKSQMEIDGSYVYNELIEFINLITENKDENHIGDRNMIDLNKMVQLYYYHPMMGGSNSLKKVLPAIMNASKFLKDKYSNPSKYGTRLRSQILWFKINGKVLNPYNLLPNVFDHFDFSEEEFMKSKGKIRDGGAALSAYMLMQFSDLNEKNRKKIINGLLKYCELDTLAMVMLWEHWNSLKQSQKL